MSGHDDTPKQWQKNTPQRTHCERLVLYYRSAFTLSLRHRIQTLNESTIIGAFDCILLFSVHAFVTVFFPLIFTFPLFKFI